MKNLGVLWLLVFVSLMGFGLTAVPFPLVAEQMGASDFWKTFGGAGVFSLFQLVATPLWGRWSDALGRKPILSITSAAAVLAYLWLAYADTLTRVGRREEADGWFRQVAEADADGVTDAAERMED